MAGLEGPEKTIDLGKKQPRGLAKRDHQNGSTVTVFFTPFFGQKSTCCYGETRNFGPPGVTESGRRKKI